MADDTAASLQLQWAVCGIAAAAARFVPVPLLDDIVRERATQTAVVRTFRAHGREVRSELLQPLWGQRGGASSVLRRRLRALPTKLLLFPVRKYTAVFGAVRGVPVDVARVVLLARTVDRRLDRGELTSADRLPDQARTVRDAVEQVVERTDLRLLTAALSDVLSQSRGLTASAVAFARRRLGATEPDAALRPDAPLAESAERVTRVLERPEIERLLDEFDARVDALLRGRDLR